MSQATHDGPIIKAATNEWFLLGTRAFMSGGISLLVALAVGIRDDQASIKRDFINFQLTEEARISKLEGALGAITGSIEVHRKRLEGNDSDIRSLWARVYDLASGRSTPRPNP